MFDRDIYVTRFSDILSLRDLADSTISNYLSYLNQFLDFILSFLGGKLPEDVTWEEIRSYIRHLKDVRKLNPRSINPHIAQLRDFFLYVLYRDWDPVTRSVPSGKTYNRKKEKQRIGKEFRNGFDADLFLQNYIFFA